MKRKLITAGIFLALAAAMALTVVMNVPKENSIVASTSATAMPRGTLAMPASGTDDKFQVTADLPATSKPARATTPPPAAK